MKQVYFIRPVGMSGPIKIGCSEGPLGRLHQHSRGSPVELELITSMEGDGAVERSIHAMFMRDHLRNEWFAWSPKLQALIESVQAGTFDRSSLPAPRRVTYPRSHPASVHRILEAAE